MTVLRLQRIGRKAQPSYRLVVANGRSKLNGPPIEDLGSYNVFTKKHGFKAERVKHWLSLGAKATVTVHNLLVKNGVINEKKIPIKMKIHKSGEKAKENPSLEVKVEVASGAVLNEGEKVELKTEEVSAS